MDTTLLFDSHCHLEEIEGISLENSTSSSTQSISKNTPLLPSSQDAISVLTLTRHPCCLNSVKEEDWNIVSNVASQHPHRIIVPGFGIHPWNSAEVVEGYLDRLQSLLLAHPTAFVGEIGVHKPGYTAESYMHQWSVFKAQLEIASRLRRTVSVHCVGGFGALLAMMMTKSSKTASETLLFPPTFVLHSYGGSSAMVNSLLNASAKAGCRFMFGFSNKETSSRHHSRKMSEVLRSVPDDNLLIETDSDAFSADSKSNLLSVSIQMSKIRCVPLQHIMDLTYRNAKLCFMMSNSAATNEKEII
jgi:TatD DNase family protein